MDVTVRYFAAAADAAACESEIWVLEPGAQLGDLRRALTERYGEPMRQILSTGSFLVDGTVRRDDGAIRGSLVDVLPPFAGG